MTRDETPEAHPYPCNDAIMKARRESFTDGYAQAVQDVQSWMTMLPAIPAALLVEKLLANSFSYRNMLVNVLAIDEGIKQAEAGQTVDRGDFTQYLSEEEKAEMEEGGRYADMVNAPLRPETVAAIAKRIKSGDLPTRTIKPRKDTNDDA